MSFSSMLDWLRVSQSLDGMNRERRRLILPREPQVERSRYGRGPRLHTVVMQDQTPGQGETAAGTPFRPHAF